MSFLARTGKVAKPWSLAALMLTLLSPAQGQVVPVVDSIVERQAERARNHAAERILNQADGVQDRVIERVESRAQNVQSQAIERVQNQAEERALGRIGRVQSEVDRVGQRLPAAAQAGVQRAAEALGNRGERLAGAQAREELASRLPERLTVADGAGNQAFVEIALTPDIRVIEYQWVMLVDSGQREQLQTQAPELMEFLTDTQPFTASDSEILTFTVPPDLDRDDNVLQLLPEALRDFIDRNHVYSAQAEGGNDELVGKGFLELSMRPVCEAPLGIGIIDSAVNTGHSAFSAMAGRGTGFVTRNFLDELVKQPAGHGTAVAGVLVGKGEYLQPLVPGATIYNAAVIYSQDDYHQGATVVHLLEALDWMHGQPQVRIINMSLAGPPNRLLQQGIEAIVSGGKTVVAAVGNEGPHAPSQYPAAYDSVIGVTAIALDRSIYRWANQGDYVDFAALGVSVPTARGDGSFGRESGTSIAAPVVSAFLACALLDHHSTEAALAALKSQLIDLGDPGHDPIFGHGLLHP